MEAQEFAKKVPVVTIGLVIICITAFLSVGYFVGTVLEHQRMQDIMFGKEHEWLVGEIDGHRADEERRESARRVEVEKDKIIISLQDKVILLQSEVDRLKNK